MFEAEQFPFSSEDILKRQRQLLLSRYDGLNKEKIVRNEEPDCNYNELPDTTPSLLFCYVSVSVFILDLRSEMVEGERRD